MQGIGVGDALVYRDHPSRMSDKHHADRCELVTDAG